MARGALVLAGVAVVLLGTAGAPLAAPDAYSAAEIRGWVVDAETKQPLEGVHVVAQWLLQTGLFFHSERVTRFHIMETVTDAKGEYHFPAWGPKPRPTLATLDTFADPRLTFFKPGYRLLERSNNHDNDSPLRTSWWHGKTIMLQSFRGTPQQWTLQLGLLQTRLAWGDLTHELPHRPNQYWQFFPRIVLAVLEQRRLLPRDLQHHVADLSNWRITEDDVQKHMNAEKTGQ
jgi:hypothetical protein